MNFNILQKIAWKWTEPWTDADENELRYWQDRIAYSFLLFGVSFGFFVLIFSVWLSIVEDLWQIAVLDVAVYLWVLFLFFKRTLPIEIRVFSIGFICYLLGLILLITIGPFGGGGPVWLFFFPIITGVLSNVRFSILALLINVLTILIIGWLIWFDWFDWPFILKYSREKWFVLGMNFVLLNTISTIAVTLLIRSLNISVIDRKYAMLALEEKNIQLQTYNHQLREEIDGRRKAESSLQRSEEAKLAISEWVDFIAHELRTPINSVVGFGDLGVKRLAGYAIEDASDDHENGFDGETMTSNSGESDSTKNPDKSRSDLNQQVKKAIDYFSSIKFSGMRLSKLVDDLLDLSKLQANRMKFSVQPVDIFLLFQEARMEMESLLLKKELHLDIAHDNMPLAIECDGFRIGQVVRNLISNAIKFSPNGKKISVTIVNASSFSDHRTDNFPDYPKPGVLVSMLDEGPGIPMDETLKVFEKFRQSRISRIGEGTGLGLPICKEIIEAHGGLIWAESKEGEGARIHFILPYASTLRESD
jgi:signal transduction histidine kinase